MDVELVAFGTGRIYMLQFNWFATNDPRFHTQRVDITSPGASIESSN